MHIDDILNLSSSDAGIWPVRFCNFPKFLFPILEIGLLEVLNDRLSSLETRMFAECMAIKEDYVANENVHEANG